MNQTNSLSETGITTHADAEQEQSNKTMTTFVYAMQVAAFFIGITFIIGVIINYVKKDDVRGTWLESHFRWQIKTFWFSLLWTVIGIATVIFVVGYFILLANTIWVIYRIIKGWTRLSDNKEML